MKLTSINKDYKLFTNIVVFGAIIISLSILALSYRNFQEKVNYIMADTANKAQNQIRHSISYARTTTNLIANQIADKQSPSTTDIASILLKFEAKMDQTEQDIFTWTLYDFVNPENEIIASSTQGILNQRITINKKTRPWIDECKEKPWKLISSGPTIGMISKESIISFGFGITDKKSNFLGTLSFGISIPKLKKAISSQIYSPLASIAVIDQGNNIILTSDNFEIDTIAELSREVKKANINSGFLEIEGDKFYYKQNNHNQFKIVVGTNKKALISELKADFVPKILNTLYLTLFFLILLHFFRAKLLNPLTSLASAADKLAKGDLEVVIPKSEIDEVNSLSLALNKVKQFLISEHNLKSSLQSGKDSAEAQNYKKTEFLSSTVHELKNIISGTINNACMLKENIDKQDQESRALADEIIKLGEELAMFVNDILDINQAQTGDFKIEEKEIVDLKDSVTRSIKLIQHRAHKENKKIIYTPEPNAAFLAPNLDPRRVKQIIVNIICNAIKYSPSDSNISINITHLDEEESKNIKEEILLNLENHPDIDKSRTTHLISMLKYRTAAHILIEVCDEGIGMDEQEVRIATQKYVKLKNQFSHKLDSTGLGLSIVKYLVEAQGGLLIIESEKNKGTTVKVIF